MGGRDSGGGGICTVSELELIEKLDVNRHDAPAPFWTHRAPVYAFKKCVCAQTRNCAKGCPGEWDGAAEREKEKSEGIRFLQQE